MRWIDYSLNLIFFNTYYKFRQTIDFNLFKKSPSQKPETDFELWENELRSRYLEQSILFDKGEISHQEFMKTSKNLLEEIMDKREIIKSKYNVSENEIFDYILMRENRIP